MSNPGCYKTTNNKYFNCPPRMSDGRHFTDYRPSCDVNNLIGINNNLISSYDYRMFLTNNAEKLMNLNRVYTVQKNACGPCKKPYNVGTMLPEQSTVSCNSNSCRFDRQLVDGLGQGRKYSKEESSCGWDYPKRVPHSKCTQDKDVFDYYGSQEDMKKKPTRLTSQSAGVALGGGDPSVYFN